MLISRLVAFGRLVWAPTRGALPSRSLTVAAARAAGAVVIAAPLKIVGGSHLGVPAISPG